MLPDALLNVVLPINSTEIFICSVRGGKFDSIFVFFLFIFLGFFYDRAMRRDTSRYDSFHVVTLSQKLVHSYLLHFANPIHASLVLAQRTEFGRNRVKRRPEVNTGVRKCLIFVMGPNMQRDLEDHQQSEKPAKVNDGWQEDANWIYLSKGCSNGNGFHQPITLLRGTFLAHLTFLDCFWNLERYPSSFACFSSHNVDLWLPGLNVVHGIDKSSDFAVEKRVAKAFAGLFVDEKPVHFSSRWFPTRRVARKRSPTFHLFVVPYR